LFKKRKSGIQIKSTEQLEGMRAAGLMVGRTLERLAESVKPGITTADLDQIEEVRRLWQFFRDRRPETYGDLAKLL
jgi:hypothetical protein